MMMTMKMMTMMFSVTTTNCDIILQNRFVEETTYLAQISL